MDEDVMGNGSSRYAGDFASNASVTRSGETGKRGEAMRDGFFGPWADGATRGLGWPSHAGEEKKE